MSEPHILDRDWRDRSNTIGSIPGKSDEQTKSLHSIVDQLPVKLGSDVLLRFATGETRLVKSDEFFPRQLTAAAIVCRTSDGDWDATPATRYWHESEDDIFYARHLHAHVKLFGELLDHINENNENLDDRALLKLAQRFNLTWTSMDQVRRRLGWMKGLGLIERWVHGKLVVTDKGRHFLSSVTLAIPENLSTEVIFQDEEPADIPEAQPFLATAIEGLSSEDLKSRKILIGYVPRGTKSSTRTPDANVANIFDALRNYLDLVGSGASSDDILEKAISEYGQKKSSYNQSMHTLRHMGVIHPVSFNRYGVPAQISTILQPGNEVDFIRHLHSKYRFIGELLHSFDGTESVSNLAKLATDCYGLGQIDNDEVRTRLLFLADAGLVERIDWTRYRITTNGRALASELPLESPDSHTTTVEGTAIPGAINAQPGLHSAYTAQGISEDLRKYGFVGNSSEEFELAVARAFEFLGFRTEHLGGPGQTDVLLTVDLGPEERYRAIVDAKSSSSGIISDNALTFDVIKDHEKKHKAHHAAVVGPEFTVRVKEWASNHKIKLVTIEELIAVLEKHSETPLTLPELRILFESFDEASAIFDAYSKAVVMSDVITKIVSILFQEVNDDDPMAQGYISIDNIHFMLRKELNPRPSLDVIKESLGLLESSLVRAVQRSGDKYKLADVPANVARRLVGIGESVRSVKLQVDE